MGVKLNSSGGGSVTIDPVSTASNATISIPATPNGSVVVANSSGNISVNAVAGTTGTFSSAVSGTTGTFTGNVQMASANGGQLAGLRNKIINGNMQVNQRGATSATVTSGSAALTTYPVDRFYFHVSAIGVNATFGVVNDATIIGLGGSSNHHIYSKTNTVKANLAAGDYVHLVQYIEGFNVADLKWGTASAKPVTISFRANTVSMGASSVITVSLRNAGATRCYLAPVTITNSAATYSVTIPGDTSTASTWQTDNGVGIILSFCLGAGSSYISGGTGWLSDNFIAATGNTNFLGTVNAEFKITDIQLEAGSVATPFEHRPIGMELDLCKRYYEEKNMGWIGQVTTVNGLIGQFHHYHQKRAVPTLTVKSIEERTANVPDTYLIGGVSVVGYIASGVYPSVVRIWNNRSNATAGECFFNAVWKINAEYIYTP